MSASTTVTGSVTSREPAASSTCPFVAGYLARHPEFADLVYRSPTLP